jgi:hypothetical protein
MFSSSDETKQEFIFQATIPLRILLKNPKQINFPILHNINKKIITLQKNAKLMHHFHFAFFNHYFKTSNNVRLVENRKNNSFYWSSGAPFYLSHNKR